MVSPEHLVSSKFSKPQAHYLYMYMCIHVDVHVGRHNCLWCTIPSSHLKLPLHQRGAYPVRTLSSLKEDHAKFVAAGGNISQAKNYNNVISSPIFDIEIDQVNMQVIFTYPIDDVLLIPVGLPARFTH